MRRVPPLCALLLLVLAASPPPAAAQGGEPPASPLSAQVDERQDARIAEGLRRRLSQIEGLGRVEVEVDAGVVRLRGAALSLDAMREAEDIARRTEGVARVRNDIELERDVGQRLEPVVEGMYERLLNLLSYLPLLGVALVVWLAFAWLARLVARWQAPWERLSANRFVQDLARHGARAAVLLAGSLLALDLLGATALVGALLGAAGVVGVALGFAFRDLVENFIASVLLSLRQPFAPNDFVDIDGYQGKVVRLTSRATILMTLDGNHLRIPNARVFKGVMVNYTRNPLRRFDFGVGVGVGEDLAEAQRLGVEILTRAAGVLADPSPWARVEELGDSSVLVRFYGWVDQRRNDFLAVKSEGIRRVKSGLEEAGMDLPEPTYRLHVLRDVARSAAPSPAPAAAADVSAGDPVDRQIAEERATTGEKDLLDPQAPRE